MAYIPKVKLHLNEGPTKIAISEDGLISYKGYPAERGADPTDDRWAVERWKYENDEWNHGWAGGSPEKKFAWSERAQLSYS